MIGCYVNVGRRFLGNTAVQTSPGGETSSKDVDIENLDLTKKLLNQEGEGEE
jgi:hypothetical protein